MYPDLLESVKISRDWRYIPDGQWETKLFKSIIYSVLSLPAIGGVVAALFYAVFLFAKSDVTIEQISVGDSSSQGSQEGEGTQVITIISLIPKDAIPAILEPEFACSESAESPMTDTELVIGVSINGDARTYPINILSRHEIVNDVVGGESIAVTW